MIVVVGEALVDIIVDAEGDVSSVVGGAPLNTARTIARLDQRAGFLGGVSTDALGRRIMRLLQADGVEFLGRQVEAPTTLAIAELDGGGSATYRFMLEGTSAASVQPDAALSAMPEDCSILHVGTLGLVLEPLSAATIALVESSPPDRIVMVDPNCRPAVMGEGSAFDRNLEAVLRRADIVKISTDDAAFLDPGAIPEATAARLAQQWGCVVLLTDGARAVVVLGPWGSEELPVPAVPVVDTVGAGDAFSGGFLAAWVCWGRSRSDLADRQHVLAAARIGIEVAALTCLRAGADPPRLHDLATGLGKG